MEARRSGPSTAALAAAFFIACMLHAALAAILHHQPAKAPVPDAPASTRTTIEVQSVVLATAMAPAPEPEMGPSAEAVTEAPAADLLAPAEAAADEPPEDLSAKPPAAPGRRYYASSEVDTPAAPLPDWNVDVDTMVALGVERFSFDVLVGATGIAERCTVTRIEPEQSLATRNAVAERLCTTELRPAQRQGSAVPSIRHIELVVAPP